MNELRYVGAAALCFAVLTTNALAHHTEVTAPEFSAEPRQKPPKPALVGDILAFTPGPSAFEYDFQGNAVPHGGVLAFAPGPSVFDYALQGDAMPLDTVIYDPITSATGVSGAMTSSDYVAALSNAMIEVQPRLTQVRTEKVRSICVVTNTNRCKTAKDAKHAPPSIDDRFEGSITDFIRMRHGLPALAEASLGGVADIQISFPSGSVALTETAKANIDQLAVALNDPQFANSQIQIQGAVTEFGSEATNTHISQLRAAIVVERLELLGVDRHRLYAVGLGSSTGYNNVQIAFGH